jgi:hypothetical protein
VVNWLNGERGFSEFKVRGSKPLTDALPIFRSLSLGLGHVRALGLACAGLEMLSTRPMGSQTVNKN